MWILKPVRLDGCSGVRQFILRVLSQQLLVKSTLAVLIVVLIPGAEDV